MTADLLQLYGVDVGDTELMRSRPWSWLTALIEGCLSVRSRLLWERAGPDLRKRVMDTFGQGADVTPWL